MRKAADALRPGGFLATITTLHVAGGSDDFFRDSQACYRRWDPAITAEQRLPEAADIALDSDELDQSDRSDRFGPATFHRYEHDIDYSTADYLDTLMTYSGHRAMDPAARRGLLACIAKIINEQHHGMVTKRYLYELRVAQLRSHHPASPPQSS